MRAMKTTPSPLHRPEGLAVHEGTAHNRQLTALQRHARSVIIGQFRHQMEREPGLLR